MRRTAEIDELIADLRDLAEASAADMNEDLSALAKVMSVTKAKASDTTEGAAAAMLGAYHQALVQIADGTPDAPAVAEAVLAISPEPEP